MIPLQQRKEYYRNQSVRARIREFLGGDSGTELTCGYLTGGDESGPRFDYHWSDSALDSLLESGFEICRSLRDETSLLADFDVEYVNFDRPAEAFLEPERIFDLQQPVAGTIERMLRKYGIDPLHLMSGRGHHFVWRIRRGSDEFNRLVRLGKSLKSPWRAEDASKKAENKPTSEEFARAFAGLGLVMEFLAYQIKDTAAPDCEIPVELTALEVGPSAHGREMISLDISEYGDPLDSRMTRAAFSVYLKPWQYRWGIDSSSLRELPSLFVIPLQNISWREAIRIMRDSVATAKLAEISCTKIPDASRAMARLIDDYANSNVAKFHRWFYSQEPHGPERWSETYDRLSLDILPACARMILERPNDLLLRPGCIRLLVRVMLSLGWHPRHIAGLIHSKYARPFGWTQFPSCNRAMRADFYTRIFSGLFVTRHDDLVDFNCVSAQEQKVCSFSNCGFNLLDFKESALNRRTNDKLAHRPFNRLLLQPEHF